LRVDEHLNSFPFCVDNFDVIGKVVYATADGDMGIVFARIERNDQVILEKWISELRDR
jgi:hypothetical protein